MGQQFDSDDELRQTLRIYLQFMSNARSHTSTSIASPQMENALFLCRKLRIGGDSKAALLSSLAAAGVELNEHARSLFENERFAVSPACVQVHAMESTVASLGFPDGGTFHQLVAAGAALGLATCPLEFAPYFRLQYLDQPEGHAGQPSSERCAPPGSVTVLSSQHEDFEKPQGFYLRRIDGALWLRGYRSDSEHVWSPQDRILLAVRDNVA